MNPIKMLKLASKFNKLLTLIQQGSASYQRTGNMSKSLFASKVFWLNALTAATEITGMLSGIIPPGNVTIISSILNIALRIVTRGPVHVLSEAGKK